MFKNHDEQEHISTIPGHYRRFVLTSAEDVLPGLTLNPFAFTPSSQNAFRYPELFWGEGRCSDTGKGTQERR
jgi:hypothetical protein